MRWAGFPHQAASHDASPHCRCKDNRDPGSDWVSETVSHKNLSLLSCSCWELSHKDASASPSMHFCQAVSHAIPLLVVCKGPLYSASLPTVAVLCLSCFSKFAVITCLNSIFIFIGSTVSQCLSGQGFIQMLASLPLTHECLTSWWQVSLHTSVSSLTQRTASLVSREILNSFISKGKTNHHKA